MIREVEQMGHAYGVKNFQLQNSMVSGRTRPLRMGAPLPEKSDAKEWRPSFRLIKQEELKAKALALKEARKRGFRAKKKPKAKSR